MSETHANPFARLLRDWVQLINEASSKFGKEFNIAPKLKQLMIETGWVDVNQKVVHVST